MDPTIAPDEEITWVFETEDEADASLRGHAEIGVWAKKCQARDGGWCVVTKREDPSS